MSAGFCLIKMHFGMQALAPFFGSLQALDFKTQRKKWSAGFGNPPWYAPTSVPILVSSSSDCDYECTREGGCKVTYVGPSRTGKTQGSCFPDSFGGHCIGTPDECSNCNEVIQCSEDISSSTKEFSWTEPVSACIWEGNIEIVNDVTLEECQEKCDSATTFPCRSVEWSDSGLFAETCWMSNLTSADTDKFQRPCSGLFSNLLFSEKLEDPITQEDVSVDVSDFFVHWSCEFCTEASSALVSHSTSTSSLQDESELLVSELCPSHPDPDSCSSSLPTFWAQYGKLIWSGFWQAICLDQDCSSNDGVPQFWYKVAKTLATCSDCRERIEAHLRYLDGKTVLNKYERKLPVFCDTQEDVEECNELGEWFAPHAFTFLKEEYRQNADWINDICQLDLDCTDD